MANCPHGYQVEEIRDCYQRFEMIKAVAGNINFNVSHYREITDEHLLDAANIVVRQADAILEQMKK